MFAEPILHVTDEDAIVHDRSATFFKIAYKMVRRVLIVDTSREIIGLLREHILSMFPHVAVDYSMSGQDALNRMKLDSTGDIVSHEYDIIVVDEHCCATSEGSEHNEREDFRRNVMTGSQLLKLIHESESRHSEKNCCSENSDKSQRKSLMIGMTTDMSEDCNSLRRGGADLLWSKPPPRPTNCLRNQLLNTLLNKRGKSIFICGC